MYCVKCGTKMDDGNNFCPKCGEEVKKDETAAQQQQSQLETAPSNKNKKKTRIIVVSVAVVIILAAIIIVCVCLQKDKDKTEPVNQMGITDEKGYEGMLRLDNATLNVRKGINNKTGEICGNAITDSDGIVYLQLKPGMYTVEVSKPGYAVAYYTISVVQNNMMITINATPVLNEGEVRIVLTWDDIPYDLDSHLFTPYDSSSGDTTYHIWYGNRYDDNDNNLDVDDTDGYGPETMTINNLGNGLYKYYVADYSDCSNGYTNSTDMSYSNATVAVYTEEGLVRTFHVPANRPGVIWEVFEIRNKTIVPLQRYYSTLDNKTWWNNDK